MHPSYLLLLGASSAMAAVHMYGPLGDLADSMQCESPNFNDTQIADLIALQNAQDSKPAIRTGNNFQYYVSLGITEEFSCKSDNSAAVGLACLGIPGGNATCISRLLPKRSRVMPRQTLSKRNSYYCKDASQQCENGRAAHFFGECDAGYTTLPYVTLDSDGHGSLPGQLPNGYHGFLCTKPCTSDQAGACIANACSYKQEQCTAYPTNTGLCVEALQKCRTISSVAMDESICKDSLLPTYQGTSCEGCVSYSNGNCTLDNTKFEAFQQTVYGDVSMTSPFTNVTSKEIFKISALGLEGQETE